VAVAVATEEDDEEKLELMSCRKMSPSSSWQQQPIGSEIEICVGEKRARLISLPQSPLVNKQIDGPTFFTSHYCHYLKNM